MKKITFILTVLFGLHSFFPILVSAENVFAIEKVEIEKSTYLDEDSRSIFPYFSSPAKNVHLKVIEKKTGKTVFEETYPEQDITPEKSIFSFLVYKVLASNTEYSYSVSGDEQATGKSIEYPGSFMTSGTAIPPSTPAPILTPSPTPVSTSTPSPIPTPILSPVLTPSPIPQDTSTLFFIEKVTVEKRGYAEVILEDGRRILPFFSTPAKNVRLKVVEKKTHKIVFDEAYPESKIQPDDTVFVFGFDDLSPLTEYSYNVIGEERTTGKKAEYTGIFTTNDFVSEKERDTLKSHISQSIETAQTLKEKARSLGQQDSVQEVDQWIDPAKKCFDRISDEGGKNREVINECSKNIRLLDELHGSIESVYNFDKFLKSKKDLEALRKLFKDKVNQKMFKEFSLNANEVSLQVSSKRSLLEKLEMLKKIGNNEEAQELFEESGELWDAKDLRSLFSGFKKIHDLLKKVRDPQLKQKLVETLQPILLETREGSYESAADALEVYMKELKKYESALKAKSQKGDLKKRILESFEKLEQSLIHE